MVAMKFLRRGYSLHQSQRARERETTYGGPKDEAKVSGNLGIAYTRRRARRRSGNSSQPTGDCGHGEVPQEARLRKRWLTWMCQQTTVGVALKRRGPLESLVHGNRACHGSGEGRWKRAGASLYLAGGLSYEAGTPRVNSTILRLMAISYGIF